MTRFHRPCATRPSVASGQSVRSTITPKTAYRTNAAIPSRAVWTSPRLTGTPARMAGSAALADLDAIEQLHKDQIIGQYDAAVVDKEDGKPHVVKRMDRPHIRVIPEWFGGGTLPRKELHEAAEQLTSSQAGLIAVGEPTIEEALDKALTKAARVVKRTVEATTDEITSELQEALKS